MPAKALIAIAGFGRLFGTNGQILLRSFTDPVEGLFAYPPPLLCGKNPEDSLIPIRFTEHTWHRDSFVVMVAGFDNAQQAGQLCNRQIYLQRDKLPPAQQGYYWHDLIGCQVSFGGNAQHPPCDYGVVAGFLTNGAQDTMRITPAAGLPFGYQGKELLIPFIQDRFVQLVDLDTRSILVNWPPDYF